jgi:hypothetical protein
MRKTVKEGTRQASSSRDKVTSEQTLSVRLQLLLVVSPLDTLATTLLELLYGVVSSRFSCIPGRVDLHFTATTVPAPIIFTTTQLALV